MAGLLTARQSAIVINGTLAVAFLWYLSHGSPIIELAKRFLLAFVELNGALVLFAWWNKHDHW